MREQIPTWSPIDLSALAFPSVLVASRNDPYCEFERARLFAYAWGAQFMDYGDCGHINADSGLAELARRPRAAARPDERLRN